MQALKKKGELNEAQLACFITPRQEEELYDVVNDPYELKNLARDPAHQNTLKTLRAEMNSIRKASKDSLPDFRTPDEFDRETGKSNSFRKRPRPSKVEMEKIIRAMSK